MIYSRKPHYKINMQAAVALFNKTNVILKQYIGEIIICRTGKKLLRNMYVLRQFSSVKALALIDLLMSTQRLSPGNVYNFTGNTLT